MNDLEMLKRAAAREGDIRDKRPVNLRSWSAFHIGATRSDINRFVSEGLIVSSSQGGRIGPGDYSPNRYLLTEKARAVIFVNSMEHEFAKVDRAELLEAMDTVIGYDDLKLEIAKAVERRQRTNILLEGPPACGKSVILEAIRTVVPDAYMAFGSRTSAAGLSQVLFEQQPGVLCLDEVEKMRRDCFPICLGLMESGEILETKDKKIRGITLTTLVIAACNSSDRLPPEFKDRFAFHPHFPPYTREQFITVCGRFLSRSGRVSERIAELIGQLVFDSELGGVRRARAIADMIDEPTEEEVRRVIQVMLNYGPGNNTPVNRKKLQNPTAAIVQPNLFT
jgi:hypothetical protein